MNAITKTKQEVGAKANAVEALLLTKLTGRFGEKKEWQFNGHKLLLNENVAPEYPIALIVYVIHTKLTDLAGDQAFSATGIKATFAWLKELGLLDGTIGIHVNEDPEEVEEFLAERAAA